MDKPNKVEEPVTFNTMQTNNKVQLLGHLGNNPEVRTLEDGNKIAKLRIATNEPYRNSEGKRIANTQWHNLVAWAATAEFAEKYLAKGKHVMVEGRLVYNNYTDKDGIRHFSTDVHVSEFSILTKRRA